MFLQCVYGAHKGVFWHMFSHAVIAWLFMICGKHDLLWSRLDLKFKTQEGISI